MTARTKSRPANSTIGQAEPLEPRCLLTGGGGSTFAVIGEMIDQPGQSAVIDFEITPSLFTARRDTMILGFDTAAGATTPSITPSIVDVLDSEGRSLETPVINPPSAFQRFGPAPDVPDGVVQNAVLRTVAVPNPGGSRFPFGPAVTPVAEPALSHTIEVGLPTDQSGQVLVGFYLPGETNDDGLVDLRDLTTIRRALNSTIGESRYNFDADANRDARVTAEDLSIALANLGVRTQVRPTISATLDSESDTGPDDRVTTLEVVEITGEATPGTRIILTEQFRQTTLPALVVDQSGSYRYSAVLEPGPNQFRIDGEDPFGQEFVGILADITLDPDAEPDPPITRPFTQGRGRNIPS